MAEKNRFSFLWWTDSTVEINLFPATSNENQGLLSFAQSHRRTFKNSKPCIIFIINELTREKWYQAKPCHRIPLSGTVMYCYCYSVMK